MVQPNLQTQPGIVLASQADDAAATFECPLGPELYEISRDVNIICDWLDEMADDCARHVAEPEAAIRQVLSRCKNAMTKLGEHTPHGGKVKVVLQLQPEAELTEEGMSLQATGLVSKASAAVTIIENLPPTLSSLIKRLALHGQTHQAKLQMLNTKTDPAPCFPCHEAIPLSELLRHSRNPCELRFCLLIDTKPLQLADLLADTASADTVKDLGVSHAQDPVHGAQSPVLQGSGTARTTGSFDLDVPEIAQAASPAGRAILHGSPGAAARTPARQGAAQAAGRRRGRHVRQDLPEFETARQNAYREDADTVQTSQAAPLGEPHSQCATDRVVAHEDFTELHPTHDDQTGAGAYAVPLEELPNVGNFFLQHFGADGHADAHAAPGSSSIVHAATRSAESPRDGHQQPARKALKRRRVIDAVHGEAASSIEALESPSPARRQGQRVADSPHSGARARLPAALVGAADATPNGKARFVWDEGNTALLLRGMEEYGTGWADIQAAYFRGQGKGSAFQSKLKDKWRTLCKGLRDKNSCRSNISLSLWDRVEKLAKLYGMR